MNEIYNARLRYTVAFQLFQVFQYDAFSEKYLYNTKEIDNYYQSVIQLLDSAIIYVPDYSDAYHLREDVWHHWLTTSRNTGNQKFVYNNLYLKSEAWEYKRQQALERDNNKCTLCAKPAEHVHHNNYDHIGKEELSDLTSLCEPCHTNYHKERVLNPPSLTSPDNYTLPNNDDDIQILLDEN